MRIERKYLMLMYLLILNCYTYSQSTPESKRYIIFEIPEKLPARIKTQDYTFDVYLPEHTTKNYKIAKDRDLLLTQVDTLFEDRRIVSETFKSYKEAQTQLTNNLVSQLDKQEQLASSRLASINHMEKLLGDATTTNVKLNKKVNKKNTLVKLLAGITLTLTTLIILK